MQDSPQESERVLAQQSTAISQDSIRFQILHALASALKSMGRDLEKGATAKLFTSTAKTCSSKKYIGKNLAQ